jgi:hypothetical protein
MTPLPDWPTAGIEANKQRRRIDRENDRLLMALLIPALRRKLKQDGGRLIDLCAGYAVFLKLR